MLDLQDKAEKTRKSIQFWIRTEWWSEYYDSNVKPNGTSNACRGVYWWCLSCSLSFRRVVTHEASFWPWSGHNGYRKHLFGYVAITISGYKISISDKCIYGHVYSSLSTSHPYAVTSLSLWSLLSLSLLRVYYESLFMRVSKVILFYFFGVFLYESFKGLTAGIVVVPYEIFL